MADNFLPEEAVWEVGVRQVETTDTVLGGPGGVPNLAPNQLANRTKFLKEKLFDNGQFLAYDPGRKYKTGDVCYTITAGKVRYWEWYSNVESLAGKDPLDASNRQSGWIDDTKPFYWTPYKKARSGTPLWPWMSMTSPEGTLNVLGNSVPTAVFWRLAEALPEFVNAGTGMIDFPETGGEFFRVLDQNRGIDANRAFSDYQASTLIRSRVSNNGGVIMTNPDDSTSLGNVGSLGTSTVHQEASDIAIRPRNLAFPILVEV